VLLVSIPVMYVIYQFEALGESLGFILGAGNSARSFALYELNSIRATKF